MIWQAPDDKALGALFCGESVGRRGKREEGRGKNDGIYTIWAKALFLCGAFYHGLMAVATFIIKAIVVGGYMQKIDLISLK
jgi:hypothetical protein